MQNLILAPTQNQHSSSAEGDASAVAERNRGETGGLQNPPVSFSPEHVSSVEKVSPIGETDCHELPLDEPLLYDTPRPDPSLLGNRGITSQIAETPDLTGPNLVTGELWQRETHYKDAIAARLREAGRPELAEPLERCHVERLYLRCTKCGRVKPFLHRCDRFYCPECQPSLTLRRIEQVSWWTRQIDEPKHIILTVRNTVDLDPGHIAEMKKWLMALRRSKFCTRKTYWRFHTTDGTFHEEKQWRAPTATEATAVSQPWRGGFYALQVTRTEHGWHPHIHILADAKFIFLPALQEAWLKINRGAGYNCRVIDCRSDERLREVVRYVSKPSTVARWTGEQIATMIDALQGQRTFGVFGTLYKLRAEFRTFLDSLLYGKPICICGSQSWRLLDQNEFDALNCIPDSPQSAPRPPPAIPDPQLTFAN